MKKVFLVCFHVLKKSLRSLQGIVQNQRYTEYSYEVPSGSKSAREGRKDMCWRKWRCYSFCLSGIHFVCLVYKCTETALDMKAYLGWYIYIHLIFFHRKLFSKKLQLLLFEEVEWLKEPNEEKNQWPRRTEIRIKN